MMDTPGGLPDLGRLRLLVELSRLGTMAAVAEATGYSTSAVSKQLAVLEQEVGGRLLSPVGRRVRLTPGAERLVERAVVILALAEEAQAELRGESEPAGWVRLASFATATEPVVLPALGWLRREHPRIEVHFYEYEPEQTLELLHSGAVDLGVVYDYSLAPRGVPSGLSVRPMDEQPLYLAAPAAHRRAGGPAGLADLKEFAEDMWITNSRGSDDDELVRRVCALAGFSPTIAHRVDNLHIVNALVGAGLGVALIAESGIERHRADVAFKRLDQMGGVRRSFLVARRGRWSWPPIDTVGRYLLRAAKE